MRTSHLTALAVVLAAVALPAQAGASLPGTIAFQQHDFASDSPQLYVASADGTSGAVALTSPASAPDPSACLDGDCVAEQPDWSPDGSRVFFDATWVPFVHLWSIAPDGTNPVMEPAITDFDGLPGVSRDGSLIAWDGGNADGSEQGIYLRTLGSSTATRLTTGPSKGFDSSPDISPDDSRVVFTRFHGPGTRVEIWSVRTDGTGLRRLLSGGRRWGDPHFSPDGSKILVQAYDELSNQGRNSNEFTIRPDGTGLTQLTDEKAGSFSFSGAWSPDGAHIVYVHVTGGDDSLQIRAMTAAGHDESLIVDCDPDVLCDDPAWGVYAGPLPARHAALRTAGAPTATRHLSRAVIRRLTSR